MTLQDDVHNLATLSPFQALPPEALRLIAFSAETRILRAGDVLFRKGDTSDSGYVLRSGSFAVETGSGATTIVWPPAVIGELALLAETERPATVTARDPASVLRITRVLFRRILSEYPDGAARLYQAMTQRLTEIQKDLNGLALAGRAPSPEGRDA